MSWRRHVEADDILDFLGEFGIGGALESADAMGLPERTRISNARKSKVRSAVEHVFAHQKGPMGLVVRTIGIARAKVKIGMANIAYNMRRFVWLSGKYAAA